MTQLAWNMGLESPNTLNMINHVVLIIFKTSDYGLFLLITGEKELVMVVVGGKSYNINLIKYIDR